MDQWAYFIAYIEYIDLKSSIAWTTAAVDNRRVLAAIPIVMDMLNLQKVGESRRNTYMTYIDFAQRIWCLTIEYVQKQIKYTTIAQIILKVSYWMDVCI